MEKAAVQWLVHEIFFAIAMKKDNRIINTFRITQWCIHFETCFEKRRNRLHTNYQTVT